VRDLDYQAKHGVNDRSGGCSECEGCQRERNQRHDLLLYRGESLLDTVRYIILFFNCSCSRLVGESFSVNRQQHLSVHFIVLSICV
jgi:hypothetical protein